MKLMISLTSASGGESALLGGAMQAQILNDAVAAAIEKTRQRLEAQAGGRPVEVVPVPADASGR